MSRKLFPAYSPHRNSLVFTATHKSKFITTLILNTTVRLISEPLDKPLVSSLTLDHPIFGSHPKNASCLRLVTSIDILIAPRAQPTLLMGQNSILHMDQVQLLDMLEKTQPPSLDSKLRDLFSVKLLNLLVELFLFRNFFSCLKVRRNLGNGLAIYKC